MRKHTVVGIIASRDGLVAGGGWSTPLDELRVEQPSRIPINIEHRGAEVGELVYLERYFDNLWGVGEVDAEPVVVVRVGTEDVEVEAPLFFSAERDSRRDDTDIILRSVAITRTPARLDARATPLEWYPGDLSRRGAWHTGAGPTRGLITRAAEERHTRHGRALLVRSYRDVWAGLEGRRTVDDDRPPSGAWWHGGHGQVLDVR